MNGSTRTKIIETLLNKTWKQDKRRLQPKTTPVRCLLKTAQLAITENLLRPIQSRIGAVSRIQKGIEKNKGLLRGKRLTIYGQFLAPAKKPFESYGEQ